MPDRSGPSIPIPRCGLVMGALQYAYRPSVTAPLIPIRLAVIVGMDPVWKRPAWGPGGPGYGVRNIDNRIAKWLLLAAGPSWR